MNIRITRLKMTNFKCFREKEINLDKDVVIIEGRNGEGKTTIADAILFCLFGKNTAGQSDLELFKTRENSKVIPNLDHSVEIDLVISQPRVDSDSGENYIKNVTLKRSIKEEWVKKRGGTELVFKNNKQEFLINGEDYKPTDYKKYIDSLVNETVFRAITNPTYFTSLKWQDQRDFLTRMESEIEPEVIANTQALVDLVHLLDNTGEDIIEHRKHISYQIKGIKDKLEKIPVRLEELNKTLPEQLDWDALDMEAKKATAEQEEITQKIIAIKSGNGQDVQKEELRKQLDNIYAQIRQRKDEIEKQCRDASDNLNKKITEYSTKFNNLLNDQRDTESFLGSFDRLTARCKETLDQCEKDAQDIRKKWAENQIRTLAFGDNDYVCPTCGQYLPEEQVREKRLKAEAELLQSMADTKTALTERADKVKALIADTKAEIKSLEEQKTEAQGKLEKIKESINETFAAKQTLEKEKAALPSFDDMVVKDETIATLGAQTEEISRQLDGVSITSEDEQKSLDELVERKDILAEGLNTINRQLATKEQRLHILALIDSVKDEEKDLLKQLSELEKKEDIARQYQDRQNTILEERINKHFSLVQWKLFQTVNNGGDPHDEPWCECFVGGNPYHGGLNDAAKLNGGLDIINTLCRHYKVSAPIVLDNSESTIDIIKTVGQQIRLKVADTDLQIV